MLDRGIKLCHIKLMQTLEKLYKVDSQGRLREWTMHIDDNSFYAVKGLVGMKLTQDKPTTSTAKNIGRSNETTDAEQAVLEAMAKWEKKLKEGGKPVYKDGIVVGVTHKGLIGTVYTGRPDSNPFQRKKKK